jgi:hypothetical protein
MLLNVKSSALKNYCFIRTLEAFIADVKHHIVQRNRKQLDGPTDGRTDGRTDRLLWE